MYYFDHSATTPVQPAVLDLMNSFQSNVYGNPSSIHSQGRKARSIIENARKQVAKSIQANPNQIIFTSGGTEANNQVLWSMVQKEKKHVISNVIEHPAVIKVLQSLEPFGLKHTLVPVNKNGFVSVKDVENSILDGTGLISIMLGNNEMGTIQPVKEIVEMAHEKGLR